MIVTVDDVLDRLAPGTPVRIHRNLHKRCYSVSIYHAGSGVGRKARMAWRVVAHVQRAKLIDCTFRVSEAGRQSVLARRKKNVHAFIYGTLVQHVDLACYWQPIGYNPYTMATFSTQRTGAPVRCASQCQLVMGSGVSAAGIR